MPGQRVHAFNSRWFGHAGQDRVDIMAQWRYHLVSIGDVINGPAGEAADLMILQDGHF